MTFLSFLPVGIPAQSRLVFRPVYPQDIVPEVTTRVGGHGSSDLERRRRELERQAIEARRRRVALAHELALAEHALLLLKEEKDRKASELKVEKRQLREESKETFEGSVTARKQAEREYLYNLSLLRQEAAEQKAYFRKQEAAKRRVVAKVVYEREQLAAEEDEIEKELEDLKPKIRRKRMKKEVEFMLAGF